MEISRALEEDVQWYQGMHRELKRKERQLTVSMFVRREQEEAAASNFRDNERPDLAFCCY
jgi:hypothetical protein